MSTKTGRAPSRDTAPAVAKKVKAGQITSSPGPMSSAISASSSASEPEPQVIANRASQNAASSRSSDFDFLAEDERLVLEDAIDCGAHFVADRRVLRAQVEGGDARR